MTQSDAWGWGLAALLAGACALEIRVLLPDTPRLATLPIFVPVSLEYEKSMREARKQPAGRGGEEAVALGRALSEESLDPALKPAITTLAQVRAQLLDARGRRHALNIALMDVGVAVARELSADQWSTIHMRRDALRARSEAAVFDRLLQTLP